LSRDCRRILASDWYRRIFSTRLSPERQAVPEFETTAQGCRLATSVGGVLTGRGADLIIIDDPLKPEEALSQTQRRAANEWFDHTLYSRLNDKLAGAIVVIMHRLHEDDLVGHVLAQEDWEVVRFPAIAEDDEKQLVDTVWGPKLLTRHQGEALHPAREPLQMLEHLRHMIGEYNFAGQYQQAPTPLGGGLVKAAWFKHYAASALPQSFDRIVQSWDTANKATELSDFSVCTTWGIAGNNLYLLDLLRRRMEYPELKREVRAQYERFRPSVVLIEDKASGTQLIQELIHEGLYAVTRYQPQTDKVMRMHAQTAIIENGFVHLPDAAPWLAQYLHELTVFPHGKHDDQVDSTAQLLDWHKRGAGPSSNAGIFELYRRRVEELRRGQAEGDRRVRLRVPQGIGRMNLLHLNVAADGTVEMPESEAESFLRAGWVRVDAGDLTG
jgi:predicted phage terminase large subunit-like protein